MSLFHNYLFSSRKFPMPHSNVHSKCSILLLCCSCVTKQRSEQFWVWDSGEIGKEALLHFRFFPWLVVEVRPSVFLEQSPRLLREFISLTWCLNSWAVCGQELLQHTRHTRSPVQLSSDLSSWKKGVVRTSSCKRSHQPACSWSPKCRTSEMLQVILGHVGLAVSSLSCILFFV